MRVFFHEIIAAGDDASFMEVCVVVLASQPDRVLKHFGSARLGRQGWSAGRDATFFFCH